LVESEVVAMTEPCAFVARRPLVMLEIAKLVVVAFVVVVFPKILPPVKVLSV